MLIVVGLTILTSVQILLSCGSGRGRITLMNDSKTSGTIGPATLTGLVIASMIGAGVFVTSGYALADLGSPNRVMLAWLIGGIIATCGAISYGALVKRMTMSGGEYLFLSRTFHPLVGFVAGWVSLLAGFTGAIAFAALALEAYLPGYPAFLPRGSIASLLVLITAVLHIKNVRVGTIPQNIVISLKLSVIVLFLGYAFSAAPQDTEVVTSAIPSFSISVFATSLMWISLSYSGFNAAVYVAGEARNAKRNVPMALAIGTFLVMLIYLALNAVFVYLPPLESVAGREDIAVAAAASIGGQGLVAVVRTVILLALTTSVSSMVMLGPRVYARMANDGLFPKIFSTGDQKIPRAAIALQGVLATIVIWAAMLKELLSYLGFTLSLCSALAVSSLFVLRRREGAERVPVWAYPFPPLIYVGATLVFAALAARRNPWEMLATLITILSGAIVYLIVVRRIKSTMPTGNVG